MGRRRRRVIKVVKKKLPSVFTCPKCGDEAVKIVLSRSSSTATVQCGACGVKDQFAIHEGIQIVDVYCMFTDKFYGGGKSEASDEEKVPAPVVQPAEEPETSTLAQNAEAETGTTEPVADPHAQPEA